LAQGAMSEAIDYLTRGTEISDNNAALILTSGSEEQKRRYMNTLSSETDYTVSLASPFGPRRFECSPSGA